MRSDYKAFFIIWFVLLFGYSSFRLAFYKQKLNLANKKFQFRMADAFVAVICYVPIMFVLGSLIQNQKYGFEKYIIWSFYFISLTIWMIIGHIRSELSDGKLNDSLSIGLAIVGSALWGLLVGFITQAVSALITIAGK